MLQVHHIKQRSEGGSDDEDNLIALCITCHSDVHTHRPFSRRFTDDELKQHRDSVYSLVAEGKLVPPEDAVMISPRSIAGSNLGVTPSPVSRGLSREAIEIIVGAADTNGDGRILVVAGFGGVTFQAGKFCRQVVRGRDEAAYKAAINSLVSEGYLTKEPARSCDMWRLTLDGYRFADEVSAASVYIEAEEELKKSGI
jgi:hypothetical protein